MIANTFKGNSMSLFVLEVKRQIRTGCVVAI